MVFDTAHYLHYVLDTRDDCHFTEDLLRLSPRAYLWDRLKKHHRFDNVVFVSLGDNGPQLEVLDSGSEQLLRPAKKGWFFSGRKEQEEGQEKIGSRCFLPGQFKQQSSTLLQWLLEQQKNAKQERTALVFTPESLRSLYESGDKKGQELLEKNIKNGLKDGILILWIEKDVRSLSETFLENHRWLAKLDPMVGAALRVGMVRPLLTALSDQLRSQLVDLSGYQGELWEMLLREALHQSFGMDTQEQLQNQCEYLRLCCRSGQSLMEDCKLPLKRSAIDALLQSKDFRKALREQAARLRELDSSRSLEDLFVKRYGQLLPELPDLVCDDEVTRSVTALQLPRTYLDKNPGQNRNLLQAQRSAVVLWNQPRNTLVCKMLLTVCDSIRQASQRGDWDTLTDGMALLTLCSNQICADMVLDENLASIFQIGEELLQTSAALFNQKKILEENHEDELDLYKVAKHQLTVQLGNEAILEAKQHRVEALRSSMKQAILYFDENPRSERVEQLVQQSMEDWKNRLDTAYEDIHRHDSEEDTVDDSTYEDL